MAQHHTIANSPQLTIAMAYKRFRDDQKCSSFLILQFQWQGRKVFSGITPPPKFGTPPPPPKIYQVWSYWGPIHVAMSPPGSLLRQVEECCCGTALRSIGSDAYCSPSMLSMDLVDGPDGADYSQRRKSHPPKSTESKKVHPNILFSERLCWFPDSCDEEADTNFANSSKSLCKHVCLVFLHLGGGLRSLYSASLDICWCSCSQQGNLLYPQNSEKGFGSVKIAERQVDL